MPSRPLPPVRLGVIGLGNMGAHHARTLASGSVPYCTLAAVADSNERRTADFGDVPRFTDGRALIRSGHVDAVLIATPHFSHVPIGIAALKAGLHVLMEKPIAVHQADAQRLLRAHKNPAQVFAAMFNQRTDPHYQKVRELVRSGELGALHRISWTITDWFRTRAYYESSPWRATWAGEGGGVLLNQCVHNLDLFIWIFGQPATVRSLCQLGRFHDIEVEDNVAALFELPDRTLATFNTSTGETPGTNRLEIAAERGRLVLEDNRLTLVRNEVPASEFSRTCPEGYLRPSTWTVDIPLPASRGEQHLGILKNFVAAIQSGEPLIAPASEGLDSVALINAILAASLEDRTIKLPFSASSYSKLLNKLIADSRPRAEVDDDLRDRWTRSHDFGPSSKA